MKLNKRYLMVSGVIRGYASITGTEPPMMTRDILSMEVAGSIKSACRAIGYPPASMTATLSFASGEVEFGDASSVDLCQSLLMVALSHTDFRWRTKAAYKGMATYLFGFDWYDKMSVEGKLEDMGDGKVRFFIKDLFERGLVDFVSKQISHEVCDDSGVDP